VRSLAVPRGCRTKIAQQVVERDNRWVVPYNAYLLKRYECHINVEVCTSVQAVKYVFKYIYKGSDRAHVAIQGESVDEIKQYLLGVLTL